MRRSIIFFILFFTKIIYAAEEKESAYKNLRVCTTADYKPILYKLETGEFKGVEADIISGFTRQKKILLQYVVLDFKSVIPALLTHKCDLIATGMLSTEERKKIVQFSEAVYNAKSFIIYLKNNNLLSRAQNKEDFNNPAFKLGVQAGSVYDLDLKKENYYEKNKIIKFDRESDLFLALLTKKIDFTINGSQFLHALQKEKPDYFNYIEENRDRGSVAFAMRKNQNILLKKINSYLAEIKEMGNI